MKTKEIYEVIGVPPATLFDWSKPGHKKESLAKLLKQLSKDDFNPYEKYALKTIKKEAFPSELEEFVNYCHIPKARVKKVLAA